MRNELPDKPDMSLKDCRILLLLMFLFGVSLRLVCVMMEPTVTRDEMQYLLLAQKFADSGSFQGVMDYWSDYWMPPMLIWIMQYLIHLGFNARAAGLVVNIVLGSLMIIPGYGIAKLCFDSRKFALATAFLVAVNPMSIELSTTGQRDVPYLFFIGLALYFALKAIKFKENIMMLYCGISFSCALLNRFEALELIPIICAYGLFAPIFKFTTWKKIFASAGLFIVGALLTLVLFTFLMRLPVSFFNIYLEWFHLYLDKFLNFGGGA